MIHAAFRSEGPLEKPDVIGAVFGQTEGLLGADMELRELQKEGRIGRIEVELELVDGKSLGEITVPTALDKSETTLVAAALETIERIGPTEASIEITKIEDVRGSKREYILERAKKLMNKLENNESFKELSESVKEESRALNIQEYGAEKLPAGDLSGNEIIVVEGRADVVNLLKNRVNNVVGMNGTKLPREIAELGKTKEITLFVDGDRGGKLITSNVIANANVAFTATAPDGKEVEELTGKEILIALRRKVAVPGTSATAEKEKLEFSGDIKEKLRNHYRNIKGTRQALLLDSSLDSIKKVSAREISRNIKDSRKKVSAIVIDGNANSAIIKICDENNISYVAATNFAAVPNTNVELISL